MVDLPSFFLRFARDKCGEDEIASVHESPDRTFPDRDDFAVADWPPFDARNANPFNRWLRSCEFREMVIARCRALQIYVALGERLYK